MLVFFRLYKFESTKKKRNPNKILMSCWCLPEIVCDTPVDALLNIFFAIFSPSSLLISFSYAFFSFVDKIFSICFPVLFTTTTIHKAHCLLFWLPFYVGSNCIAWIDNKIIRLLLRKKKESPKMSVYGKKLNFCVLFIFIYSET